MRILIGILMVCAAPGMAWADTFSYDASGRLLAVDQANGLTHTYTTDAEANLLSGLSSGANGGNGIADWWENFYFATTGVNALASAAGDGVSNLTKFALGLNPQTAISSPLVTVTQEVFTDEQIYKFFTFVRDKANASMLSLEQSSDQVNWVGGSAYFEQVGEALDLGNGTERVTYRNLTPLPAVLGLSFRLVTNGGSGLLAYNTISSGTAVPALPWWVFAVLVLVLPLLAGRFLRRNGAVALVFIFAVGANARADNRNGWRLHTNYELPQQGLIPALPAAPFPQDSPANEGAAAFQLFGTEDDSPTEVTPELQALATTLNNNPLTIFNYVRNKMDFQPYWGSHKGAHGTFLDAAGNDMDQASLLIALLHAAGYSQTSYVKGRISVPVFSVSQHDLAVWLGTNSTLAQVAILAANIPHNVPLTESEVATFEHIWVRAVIGGTTYDLDPSYKRYQRYSSINYRSVSGYSRSQLLSDAGGTEGTDFVENLSRSAVENRLGQYAVSLRNYIRTNLPGAITEQIFGGAVLFEEVAASLAAAAPRASFSPIPLEVFSDIPSSLRGSLRVQAGPEIDLTFPSDTLQARPLALSFEDGNARLWLGEALVAEETGGSGATIPVTLSTTHPVSSLSESPSARSYSRTGTYDLTCAFYPNPKSSGRIEASDRRLVVLRAAGLPDTAREVLSESLHGLGLRWVRRSALCLQLVSRVTGCYGWIDSKFGRTGQEDSFFVDMYGGVANVFNDVGPNVPAFAAQGFAASAMEHGVIEEQAPAPAVSTVKCLALANDGGQKIFRATPSNFSTVVSQLTGYSGDGVTYISANLGDATLLHENGATAEGDWSGYGFASMGSDFSRMLISGGYSGGYYTSVNFNFGVQFYSKDVEVPYGVAEALSAEPVNLATGAYTMAVTDLALGEANGPRGLAFSRSYDSLRHFENGPLGSGWRHSCEGRVLLASDLEAAFGFRQPSDAAQTVIGAVAVADFSTATFSAKELMTGILAANWMVNRITNNAADVQLGEQVLTYISQPDGSWNPPPGSTTALIGSSGTLALQPRFGGSVIFDAQNRVSQCKDADDNTQTYAYDGIGRLSTVTDSQGRALTFGYSGSSPLIQSVSDGTGRSVTYTYTGNNLTGIQDVEGFNTTLVYDSQNRLTDWKDHAGAFITRNTYDAQNRVIEQLSQGAANRKWQFRYSTGVTREIDPLGNVTRHFFDGHNRRFGVADPLGNFSSANYDSQNHVTRTVDATGRQTTFVFDANQNLTQSTDNAGKTTLYAYDGMLRPWKITDPTGRVTELGYDAENHVTSIKDPGGRISLIAYRPDGRLQSITDPANKTTTFTAYDQWANPIAVTRPDGSSTSAVFNARGDLTSSTDGRGKTTAFTYDKRRLLLTRTDALGHASSWTYDSNARPASATDRNNKTTTTAFDNFGHLQTMAAPNTGTAAFGYDLRDLPTTFINGLGHTSTTAYDIASRAVSLTDALGVTTNQATLDGAGRVLVSRNGLNQASVLSYDAVGRLSFTLDPMNRRVDHTYDFAGRPLTLKNRLNRTFTNGYGSDGLPATFTYPSGRQSAITARDPVGRPATMKEPSGQQTALTYDGLGRVKTKADDVGTITLTYDGEGNPTNIAQGSANITRTFDDLGRVLTCTDASGNTVSHTYDNEGNLATLTYPGNKTVTYTYDGSNRLKTVTDWAGRVTTYTYDNAGRLTQVDRPNGTRQRLQYDNANRLTATFEEKGAASIWQSAYGYDAAYRLISYTPTPITKTLPPPPATMTYDNDNRLAAYNGAAVTSDADGNLLSAPLNGTLLGTLTWDARNRLTSAGGVIYSHDAENRRLSSTKAGQTTTYTWSRGATLDRLLVKTNPDGSITRYIHGLGLLYEETEPAAGGSAVTQFYHCNWQGSTVALSDVSGNVTARMSYSPYGEVTIENGAVTTPFLFNGQFGVMTEANGLLCMQARFYSPIFRRFLSEDPAGFAGGINFYAYTGGDPVNLMDPFGLGPVSQSFFAGFMEGFANAFTPTNVAWTVGLTAGAIIAPEIVIPLLVAAAVKGGVSALSEWGSNGFAYDQQTAGALTGQFVGSALISGGTGFLVTTARNAGASAVMTRFSVAKGVKWNPLTGPGPLGKNIASTFRSSTYTEQVLHESTTLYRLYSDPAKAIGPYWTRTAPSGPVQSIMDNALNPVWGNRATSVIKIEAPAGTRIFEGVAAPQGGLMGGGNQIYMMPGTVNPAWVVP